ncbi:MAG: hypothetical protein A2787_09570 [Omnitrophica WOR_2 bacterium RIFCSPHIGHO2_01_FULL_48_9]|nr:MAG: hypothetical protein A3D10_01925 [Omnitrophica WOR_2 bacterium RIFCSPHIGHO2_02_FULL_48_11]OGX31121.1 MAG: hypothetical protein A2787_09570 [Omnitrophica WOR_2 bacterium RIFCSPHIGHO2_01_FULL_48_9]
MKGETKTMQPFKLAFVGGGLNSVAGYTHFSASRMDHKFQVATGVFSRNKDTNQKTVDFWGIKDHYPSFEELLEKEAQNVAAFVVLLPTPDHYQAVAELLKRNIPVICEKPLAYDCGQIKALQKIYNPQKHFLVTTYNYSGYPLVRELKAMIEAGEFGDILHIHLEMPQESFLRPPKTLDYPPGWRKVDREIPTVCLDLGTHLFHLQKFLTGRVPRRFVSKMNSFAPYKVIDDVKIISEFDGGTTGYMWFGKTALGNRNGLRIRVFGTKASAEWFQQEPEKLFVNKSNGSLNIIDRGNAEKIAAEKRYNRMFAGHPAGFIEAFANLYRDIAEVLELFKQGKDYSHPYIWRLDDEAQNLQFFEQAVVSNKENRWVEFTEK